MTEYDRVRQTEFVGQMFKLTQSSGIKPRQVRQTEVCRTKGARVCLATHTRALPGTPAASYQQTEVTRLLKLSPSEAEYSGLDYMAFCLSVNSIPIFSSVALFKVPVIFSPSAFWYSLRPARVAESSFPVVSPV